MQPCTHTGLNAMHDASFGFSLPPSLFSSVHPRHPTYQWCREGRGREPGTQSPGRGLVRYRN